MKQLHIRLQPHAACKQRALSVLRAGWFGPLILAIGLILLVATSSAQAAARYFPERGSWEERAPRQLGLDARKLDAAVRFAQANEYPESRNLRLVNLQKNEREPGYRILGPMRDRGGPAGVILKGGYIVARWGDLDRVDMTFSTAKSYISAVAGLAWDAGLIRGVDDPVNAYVWDDTFAGAHNRRISWHHLLNQTSDWRGNLFGIDDWADRPPEQGDSDEWRARPPHAPGTTYKYNDVRVNVLAYALLQVWRAPLPQVLKEHIMDPIGASTTWRWYGYETSWVDLDGMRMNSVSGGGHFGGGIFINTWDQARFGLLYLNRGNWNGKQLLSKQWIEKTRVPTPVKPNYGYLWWLNRGPTAWPDLPATLYFADGSGGNYIVVDEEHDLVIVTRWMDEDRAKLGQLIGLVLASID